MTKHNGRGAGLRVAFALALALVPLAARAKTTLQHILAAKELTVGTEAAFPPFEYVEDGKIVGYGKDILDAHDEPKNALRIGAKEIRLGG